MFKGLFGDDSSSGLVEAAYRDFSEMLQQGAEMMDAAMAHLFEGEELDVDLDDMDDVVDDGERMIRRTVLQHLSVNPEQDLVASLILVSMVQDAERVGDFARGLAELRRIARHPLEGPFVGELREAAAEVRESFATCERAFREGDPEPAQEVIRQHVESKQRLQGIVDRLADSDLSADMAIVYSGVAYRLRRISAHLSNIASAVVQPFDRVRHGDEDV